MDIKELQLIMSEHDLFDQTLLFHSFKQHARDYYLIVMMVNGTEITGFVSYIFRYAVDVSVSTVLSADVYLRSVDDNLLNFDRTRAEDGYVWGVNASILYPGWSIVQPSAKAEEWSRRIGMTFYEVATRTNIQEISIVFSELSVSRLPYASVSQFDDDISQIPWAR